MHTPPLILTTLILIVATISGCNPLRNSSNQLILLNGEETRKLFADNTVEALNLNTGTTSFTYYANSGEVRQERLWEQRLGNWRINQKGEICLQLDEGKEGCHIIGKLGGTYRKYRIDTHGKLKPIVRYRRFLPENLLKL
ncbi:MAG: hypothetical protein ABW148_00230 [Sedimenticola sp.]